MEKVNSRKLHEDQMRYAKNTVSAKLSSNATLAARSRRQIKGVVPTVNAIAITSIEVECLIEDKPPLSVLPLGFNERHRKLQHADMVLASLPLQNHDLGTVLAF